MRWQFHHINSLNIALRFLLRERVVSLAQGGLVALIAYFSFVSWQYLGADAGNLPAGVGGLTWMFVILQTGMLLMLICLNIIKAFKRLADVGILQAIGGTPLQIFYLLFLENMILTVTSGLAGLLVLGVVFGSISRLLALENGPGFLEILATAGWTLGYLVMVNLLTALPVWYYVGGQDPYKSIRRGH